MVEAHPERVEAILGVGSLVVDRPKADEHPLVHQDHSALEGFHKGFVMLVIGRWRRIHRDVEAEHLGLEGHRPLNVCDDQSEVVNGTHGR